MAAAGYSRRSIGILRPTGLKVSTGAIVIGSGVARVRRKLNVLVHKFVCRGTVEEKIDALIESKRGLSNELLDGLAKINLTELRNEEILRLVALDLDAAMKE